MKDWLMSFNISIVLLGGLFINSQIMYLFYDGGDTSVIVGAIYFVGILLQYEFNKLNEKNDE